MFEIFKEYSGTGYLSILFVVALVYLWMTEKNKITRYIFVYGAGIIQILFFVPFFYWGYNILDEGTYYRILWLLPSTIVIAYSAVRVMGQHTKVGLLLSILVVMISGQYVYSSVYITKAENAYNIPQEVIEVCDMIGPEEGEERIWAIFPDDMIHYVRQYTIDVQMVYGREVLVNSWDTADHPLYEVMSEEILDVEELAELVELYACNYVILNKEKEVDGDLAEAGIEWFGETDTHVVYWCSKVPFPVEGEYRLPVVIEE